MKAKSTLYKYNAVYDHLKDFLQSHYHVSDIALKEILPTFITDFEAYLRADCRLSPNTVWLYTFPVRMLLHKAVENGWLMRYPFAGYEIHKEETEKGFLTKEELGQLINAPEDELQADIHPRSVPLLCFHGIGLHRSEESS